MKRKKRWRGGDWREGWRGLWGFKERKGGEGGREKSVVAEEKEKEKKKNYLFSARWR